MPRFLLIAIVLGFVWAMWALSFRLRPWHWRTHVAYRAYRKGQYDRAQQAYAAALRAAERSGKADRIVEGAFNLAWAYIMQRNDAEAEPLLRRALALAPQLARHRRISSGHILDTLCPLLARHDRHDEAIALALDHVRLAEQNPAPDERARINAIEQLAGAYQRAGKHDDAIREQTRVVELARSFYSGDHPELARHLTNLANAHQAAGDEQTAARLQTEALDIARRAPVHDAVDASLGHSLLNQARMHAERGEFAQAIPLFEQALDLARRHFGAGHAQVGYVLIRLTHACIRLERIGDALRYGKQAVAVFENVTPPDNKPLLSSLHLLAGAEMRCAQAHAARQHAARALELAEREAGPESEVTLEVLEQVRQAHGLLNEQDAAEDCLRREIAVAESLHGEDTRDVLDMKRRLVLLHKSLGRTEEADALCRHLLDVARERFSDDSELLVDLLGTLAWVRRSQGRFAESESLFDEAMPACDADADSHALTRAYTERFLADLYANRGRFDEAEPLLARALEVFDADDTDAAYALALQSDVLLHRGDAAAAERVAQQAADILRNRCGPAYQGVVEALLPLGRARQALGRLDDAERTLKHALDVSERAFGPAHVDVARGLEALADLYAHRQRTDKARTNLYAHQQRTDQALDAYARALAIREQFQGAEHPCVGELLARYAGFLRTLGRADEANQLDARSRHILITHRQRELEASP